MGGALDIIFFTTEVHKEYTEFHREKINHQELQFINLIQSIFNLSQSLSPFTSNQTVNAISPKILGTATRARNIPAKSA